MNLALNEFSILNVSEMDGLLKYGGSADFKLRMAKEGSEVVWTLTIDSPRVMELLGIFVGERTVKLVQGLDPNNLDPNVKVALQAIKSLTQKMEEAQKNPVWDPVKLTGTVAQQGTNWTLQSPEGTFTIAGTNLAGLPGRKGKPIVAQGFVKTPGQLELTRFIDQKTNTLELFVMSYCPYGQRAETNLYEFLEKATVNPKPVIEIHYLFYKQKLEGKEVFVSLHGEEEIIENLVQMVIRDRFPGVFAKYVRFRASSGKMPWPQLAELAGLGKPDITEIERVIKTERVALIQKEYDYATSRYEITDGSPTYVWESERISDLRKVAVFKGLGGAPQEACNQ